MSTKELGFGAVKRKRRLETLDFSRSLIFFSLNRCGCWNKNTKGLFGWCGNNQACMVSHFLRVNVQLKTKFSPRNHKKNFLTILRFEFILYFSCRIKNVF
jgi:hypothetical protein